MAESCPSTASSMSIANERGNVTSPIMRSSGPELSNCKLVIDPPACIASLGSATLKPQLKSSPIKSALFSEASASMP